MDTNLMIDEIALLLAKKEGYPFALGYLKALTKELVGLPQSKVKKLLNDTVNRLKQNYELIV